MSIASAGRAPARVASSPVRQTRLWWSRPATSLAPLRAPSTYGQPQQRLNHVIRIRAEKTTEEVKPSGEEAEGEASESKPPPLVVSLLGLVAAVMAGISVFYSIVFYAGGGIAYLVKDTITFTRKDFIPYSERRRLEKEAEEAQKERDEAMPQTGDAAPEVKFSETLLPSSKK